MIRPSRVRRGTVREEAQRPTEHGQASGLAHHFDGKNPATALGAVRPEDSIIGQSGYGLDQSTAKGSYGAMYGLSTQKSAQSGSSGSPNSSGLAKRDGVISGDEDGQYGHQSTHGTAGTAAGIGAGAAVGAGAGAAGIAGSSGHADDVHNQAYLAGHQKGTQHLESAGSGPGYGGNHQAVQDEAYLAGQRHGHSTHGDRTAHGSNAAGVGAGALGAGAAASTGSGSSADYSLVEVIGIDDKRKAEKLAQKTTQQLVAQGEDLTGGTIVINAQTKEIYKVPGDTRKNPEQAADPRAWAEAHPQDLHHANATSTSHDHVGKDIAAAGAGGIAGAGVAGAYGSSHDHSQHHHGEPDASFNEPAKEVNPNKFHAEHERVKEKLEDLADHDQLGAVPGPHAPVVDLSENHQQQRSLDPGHPTAAGLSNAPSAALGGAAGAGLGAAGAAAYGTSRSSQPPNSGEAAEAAGPTPFTSVAVLGTNDTEKAKEIARNAVQALQGRSDILKDVQELRVDAHTGAVTDEKGQFLAQLGRGSFSEPSSATHPPAQLGGIVTPPNREYAHEPQGTTNRGASSQSNAAQNSNAVPAYGQSPSTGAAYATPASQTGKPLSGETYPEPSIGSSYENSPSTHQSRSGNSAPLPGSGGATHGADSTARGGFDATAAGVGAGIGAGALGAGAGAHYLHHRNKDDANDTTRGADVGSEAGAPQSRSLGTEDVQNENTTATAPAAGVGSGFVSGGGTSAPSAATTSSTLSTEGSLAQGLGRITLERTPTKAKIPGTFEF